MFNRQFILSIENLLEKPKDFNFIDSGCFKLYYHIDNSYMFFDNEFITVHIVGTLVHPDHQDIFGVQLSNKLFEGCETFNDINARLYKACGRFIVICISDGNVNIRSDAVSLAQIYYDSKLGLLCTDIKLYQFLVPNPEVNKRAFDFYHKTMKSKGNGDSWIGHETIFSNLKKLIPNHSLLLNDFTVSRYWPNEKCKLLRVDDILDELSSNILSIFQALQNLAPLSIAVTAGNDSRLALAVSSRLKKESYYFIDQLTSMDEDDVDIVVGKKLTSILGLDYHIHDIAAVNNIQDSFSEQYFSSCFYAKAGRLPVVYNYKNKLSSYINICGVGEFGRSVFGWPVFKITSNFLCHKYYYTNSQFANLMAEAWLQDYKDIEHLGYNPLALFYIEQKLGNWGAVCNSESDIAFEEVNPFASHFLIDHFISIVKKDSTYINNKLFSSLTIKFQSSLMEIPINPVVDVKKKLKKFLRSLRFFDYVDYLIFLIKKIVRPETS